MPGRDQNLYTIALVGNPNVGKSVVFNALSGARATVSNYPGTTVNLTKARIRINDVHYELVDTPGMYSLLPITEEEQVARDVLFENSPDLVINVIDAKNIRRMLSLSLQLMEAGFRLIIGLNMMDEARETGVDIDIHELSSRLSVPVIAMTAINGVGIPELKEAVFESFSHVSDVTPVS